MADNYKVNEEEERRIIIDKYEKGREKVLASGECLCVLSVSKLDDRNNG